MAGRDPSRAALPARPSDPAGEGPGVRGRDRLRHTPLQNLRVLNQVRSLPDGDTATAWARRVNEEGLAACETLVGAEASPFCFGELPTVADICLVPQMINARRYGADLSGFRRLLEAEAAAMELPAFAEAHPTRQPDAE